MKIHEIKGKLVTSRKRIGRGIGSGTGKTAGRGTKGQKSRTGHHKMPAAFEGGQMKMIMRLPKRKGFKAPNKMHITLTLGALNQLADGAEVTLKELKKQKLVPQTATSVKIVAGGELTKKLTIKVPMSTSIKK